MTTEPPPHPPPFPERERYGCVNCGSINHTTGDKDWCPAESTEPPFNRDGDPGDPSRFCGYRWRAPRGDAPMSVDVEHVCAAWHGHRHPHWCACRAYQDNP